MCKMADEKEENSSACSLSTEECLSCAQKMASRALQKAGEVTGFTLKWKMIITKLEIVPTRLSDLSTHPCFSKNLLCKEQLEAICVTLKESIELANRCTNENFKGKLQMQSNLDSLTGKLDMNIRDCGVLIKTGVLGEVSIPFTEPDSNLRELFARLQIGHSESKHKALDILMEVMNEDEKNVLAVITRSNIAALVHLLSATSPKIREKTVMIISSVAELETCKDWLVSEGVLSPLIRLIETGSSLSKERAIITLQCLSISPETSRSIIGNRGTRPLIEICQNNESLLQAAATCTLRNLSLVSEKRRALAEEGIIKVMIDLLYRNISLETKEYAAECLKNLTSNDDELQRSAISEGGIRSLLSYINSPLPQESAVYALRNLVSYISTEGMISYDVIPRLVHVLNYGSIGAQQAAASTICRICSSNEMKRVIGESGCIRFLIRMLEAKENSTRGVATEALASLMTISSNWRQVKKDEKSIPNFVALLNPNPENTAKKYSVLCLGMMSSNNECKKLMIAYGAIGYLKKLVECGVLGAGKLLVCLERGKFKSLFVRK